MDIYALDHVQLAMPEAQEDVARQFYVDLLGLTEQPKPEALAGRGGVWFTGGTLRLHLGVEKDFRPARKAHPALLVHDLDTLASRLEAAGIEIMRDVPLEGFRRFHAPDPFGNRLEFLEPEA